MTHPVIGRLDGSLHIGRNSPTTAKAIPLYRYMRGIQLSMEISQWMTAWEDCADAGGDGTPVGMTEGVVVSADIRRPPEVTGPP
jgi:hypothetical protein